MNIREKCSSTSNILRDNKPYVFCLAKYKVLVVYMLTSINLLKIQTVRQLGCLD